MSQALPINDYRHDIRFGAPVTGEENFTRTK